MSEDKAERFKVEIDLVNELARDDRVGFAERRAAVKGMMTALDHLHELCQESHDNYRYLALLLDDEVDDSIEENADDAFTIETLVDIIHAGRGQSVWAARLQHKIMPELRKSWNEYLAKKHEKEDQQNIEDRYRLVDMSDDVNLKGLEHHNLEARCGKCGETFRPDSLAFEGLNSEGEGLYRHYILMTDDGDIECRGLGIITGGWK